MFERVLNAPMQLYLFRALLLRKCKDNTYQYQFVQRIQLREIYP